MSHTGVGLREEPLYKGTLGAGDLGQATRPLLPPLHILQKRTPCFAYGTHLPVLPPPLCPLMEMPPIPPGNQALAAAISRANSPRLQEPPSPSPSAQPSPPLAFLAEIFTETRNSLQLNPDWIQDLSPHALQTITAGEGSIPSILCTTVSGIVAITTQLDTVNHQLSEIRKANPELHSNLHELSSKIANESGTHEYIRPLLPALGDLSHRMTTTVPTAPPTAPTAPPQGLPARGLPTESVQPTPPHAPSQAPPLAQPPRRPPQENIDPSIYCLFNDTKLKKIFGHPELYAKAFPPSWEAELFCANQYDLSIHTPATLQPQ